MNDQAMQALGVANDVRMYNARFRQELRTLSYVASRLRLAEVLLDDSSPTMGAPVGRLLRSAPGLGWVTVTQLLNIAGIRSGDVKVRDLSLRQRELLADRLASPGFSRPYGDVA